MINILQRSCKKRSKKTASTFITLSTNLNARNAREAMMNMFQTGFGNVGTIYTSVAENAIITVLCRGLKLSFTIWHFRRQLCLPRTAGSTRLHLPLHRPIPESNSKHECFTLASKCLRKWAVDSPTSNIVFTFLKQKGLRR